MEKREILLKCLEENFKHARHQEIQRNRLNYLYFIAWGAVLSLYKKGLPGYPLLFIFLFIFSIIVFLSTLKWNIEFMNHICAIAKISFDLNINEPEDEKYVLNLYPAFRGYMGLPLQMPIIFNVSVLYAVLHSLGIATSGVLVCKIWKNYDLYILTLFATILFGFSILGAGIYFKNAQQQIIRRYSLTNRFSGPA